ncbi:MAG TPA: DUF1269 domain-containing protein [Acidimicrobiia bacterium]|nr:DUF1269 domain-containing protein [Acidimicrobiia bacterium]
MASEVIMLKFNETYGAHKAMNAVRALAELDYAWLEDVAILERHRSGRVSTHTTHGSVAAGAVWGGLTGMIVGLLFPPLGFIALWAGGMAIGAGVEKATKETGLPAGFMDTVRKELTKGTSALLLFGATGDTEEMAKAFDKYNPASIVREQITDETVDSMKKALDATSAEAS